MRGLAASHRKTFIRGLGQNKGAGMTTSFRVARKRDADRIFSFLKSYWREDHVFVRNPELMTWQHSAPGSDGLNFVMAEVGTSLVGILGFISFRSFDPNLPRDSIALAIWKRTDEAERGTGLRMLTWLREELAPSNIIAINLNPATRPIYESLGFKTGMMDQYVIFNTDLAFSKVTGQRVSHPDRLGSGLELLSHNQELSARIAEGLEELLRLNCPEKSISYYLHRFQEHPWFKYEFVTMGQGNTPVLLLVLRRIQVGESSILRVVDIAGEVERMPESATVLSDLLSKSESEYIDILAHGLEEMEMIQGGFQSREASPDLLIPNYYDPFERRNIDVLFAYHSKNTESGPFHLHPADSDQDRPNR